VSQGMEKALAVLPLFHIFGLTFIMLLAVANREQVVLHIKFDPDRVLADISRKKIPRYASGIPIIATSATPKNVRLEGPPMLLLAFSNSLSSPADLGNRFLPFLRSAAPFHRFPNRLLPRSCAGPVIQRCPAEQACPTPEAYKMLYYRADQKGGVKCASVAPLEQRAAMCTRLLDLRMKAPSQSVLSRIDKEADDGRFAKRPSGLQPVQTLNEYEAGAVHRRPVAPGA
jgi:hypothetical protein